MDPNATLTSGSRPGTRGAPGTRAAARFAAVLGCCLLLLSSSLAAVEVIKSPNDSRAYRALTLDNRMKVILISDPGTDMAAASLSVDAGSNANPPEREGLAHFLEHMLFLGTGKYPQPGEYKDFISRHGGQDNAYTAADETNYFFEIKASELEPALDRFAQFFVDPLFNREYVERERQVVHSEYLGRMKSDGRRGLSAARKAMNPQHPASRFAVGNLETLADRPQDNVRDDLIAFYRRYYSSNLMALSVFGREPLDVLERWVRARFSRVENRNASPPAVDVPLFVPGRLPALLQVVPEKEQRSLSLSFPIPPILDLWQTKPTAHIGHLLGHEGEGSLLAALKHRGWVQSLSAGASHGDEYSATFDINMQLTPDGVSNLDRIIELTFGYIELMREQGIKQWVFDENRRLGEIAFEFQDKAGPLSLARSLASAQHDLPQSEVIRGAYTYDRFDPELIDTFMRDLNARNMLVTLVAPEAVTDASTRWYDAPYSISTLDEARLARWQSGASAKTFAMPARNPFIPDTLALLERNDPASTPALRVDRPGFRLWHQQDTDFGVPKAEFYFSVRSPQANGTPRDLLLTQLYVSLVNDALDAYAYPADLAGLSFSLYTHMRGFSVRISGYDQSQGAFLARLLERLTGLAVDRSRFEIQRAELKRTLVNSQRNQPYSQAMSQLRELVVTPHWSVTERLAVIDTLTPRQLEAFIPRLLANVDVVALAHGNVDATRAVALGNQVYEAVVSPASPTQVSRGQVRKLRRGDRVAVDLKVDHPESAAVIYLQGPDKQLATRAHASMLAQVLSSPFFDRLRTERKLGYVVFANTYPVLDTAALVFIVQSPIADSATLVTEIQGFLDHQLDAIKGMSDSELEDHKRALVARVLEEERSLSQRSDRYWNEIDRENPDFDTREKMAQAIRGLSVSSLTDFYRDVMLGRQRRELVVGARGERRGPTVAPEGSITAEGLRLTRSLFPG